MQLQQCCREKNELEKLDNRPELGKNIYIRSLENSGKIQDIHLWTYQMFYHHTQCILNPLLLVCLLKLLLINYFYWLTQNCTENAKLHKVYFMFLIQYLGQANTFFCPFWYPHYRSFKLAKQKVFYSIKGSENL